jgi:thiamine-phosphate pyrophosphorylase
MPTPNAHQLADRLSVYLVADPELTSRGLLDDVARALAGGVTAVQLRAKYGPDREKIALAERLNQLCDDRSALFIVNDRIDIALATGAGGVHLGTDDLPVAAARSIVPADFVIGYSPENDKEIEHARFDGADYFGIGPVFGTQSKADAGEALGLVTLSRRASLAGISVVGIGGINADNAGSVIEAGAVGVAVLSAILGSADPKEAARQIARSVQVAKAHERHTA